MLEAYFQDKGMLTEDIKIQVRTSENVAEVPAMMELALFPLGARKTDFVNPGFSVLGVYYLHGIISSRSPSSYRECVKFPAKMILTFFTLKFNSLGRRHSAVCKHSLSFQT